MEVGFVTALLLGPVVSAVMAAIAGAAGTGRLRRNQAVGIRLPATMASEVAWRAGHRAAVPPACWSFVILLALDGVALLLRAHGNSSAALTAGLVIVVVLAIAWVAAAANRSAGAVGHAPR